MRLPLLSQTPVEPIQQRLSELGQTAATQRAAELLGNLPRPVELSPAAFARIGERLLAGPLPPPLRPRWPWAVAGTAAIGIATLAAVFLPRLTGTRHSEHVPTPVHELRIETREARAADPPRLVVTPLVSEPVALAKVPVPSETATRPVGRLPTRPARPSAALAPAVAGPQSMTAAPGGESGLAAESRLLGVALHQLRQERDGAAALRSLEVYQQRFPGGLLLEEAQAARVDALLLVDHRSEALAFLEKTQFQRLDRGGELRAVRGELRAAAGRCREALADFAAVLAPGAAPPPPLVVERALFGKASCQAQLADSQGARASLEQYLARFPTGRFAAAARTSLQNLSATP